MWQSSKHNWGTHCTIECWGGCQIGSGFQAGCNLKKGNPLKHAETCFHYDIYIYIDRWCFPIFSACPSVLFFRFAIILIIGNQNQTFGALSYNFSLWCGLRVAFETMWLKTPSLSLILGHGGENLRVADLVKATRFVTRPTKLGQLPGYPQIHQPSTGSIFWYG